MKNLNTSYVKVQSNLVYGRTTSEKFKYILC